jgi:cellulase
MVRSLAITLSLLASRAAAHTFIWVRHLYQLARLRKSFANTTQGVYVNGVDQGTFSGIRVPAYNGAPGKGGYNNGPVKDLTSIDMRCNVMGDIPTSDTIKVVPGDSLTFDW